MDDLKVKRGASTQTEPERAAEELYESIAQPDTKLVIFYCSPDYDLSSLGKALAARFGGVELIGCTTAGEITPDGYLTGALTGVSIASDDLTASTRRIDDLQSFELSRGQEVARELVGAMSDDLGPLDGTNAFAFLLVDGLSMKEEGVVSALSRGLGDIQLFGGSAGDGVRFGQTYVFHDGEFRPDCAVLTLVRTSHPFVVFKTQHFVSTDTKMVVTEADPTRRVVSEINGEPAGREYARMVGLEVDKLTPMIFSTYPVVVRVGGQQYVRAIQKVNEDESLTFFCAIDEGCVLTVAKGVDLIDNLEEAFGDVRNTIGAPALTLGCDCILRHLELDQTGVKGRAFEILERNRVIGFSTYGEQFNAMHVNQTFTGVAIGQRSSAR